MTRLKQQISTDMSFNNKVIILLLLISNSHNTDRLEEETEIYTTDYRETDEIKTFQAHLQQISLRECPTAIPYFWHSSAKPAKLFTTHTMSVLLE